VLAPRLQWSHSNAPARARVGACVRVHAQAREARETLEARVAALEAVVAANMAAAAGGPGSSVVAAVIEDTPLDSNSNGS
jgi:hypothetical protein